MCGAKLRTPTFLSAKERRKFDAGLLTLLDAVDAKPAQKLYRYRKVPRPEGPDIRFIASSARKEGHLMWPSSCAGLQSRKPYIRPLRSGTAPVRLQRHVWIGVDIERRDFTSVEFTASDLRDHGGVIGAGRQGRHRYADSLTPEFLDHHLAQMRVG